MNKNNNTEPIQYELLCNECNKTILVSENLQDCIDAIPDHRKVCKPEPVPEPKPEPPKKKAWKLPELSKIKLPKIKLPKLKRVKK